MLVSLSQGAEVTLCYWSIPFRTVSTIATLMLMETHPIAQCYKQVQLVTLVGCSKGSPRGVKHEDSIALAGDAKSCPSLVTEGPSLVVSTKGLPIAAKSPPVNHI